MKTWKQTFIGLLAIFAIGFTFTTCDNGGGKNTHTHEWEWVVTKAATKTEEGIETETCSTCGETRGTRPIPKVEVPKEENFEIKLKNETLTFNVTYKKLPSEPVPEYLNYLKTRLELVVNSSGEAGIEATEYLMSKGNEFTINVEDTGTSYAGLLWDNATKAFRVHNDWISTASSGDLSAAMIRNAFNSVEIE